MMDTSLEWAGFLAGYGMIWLLCISGIVLSALSFSGTWCVVIASMWAVWMTGADHFPGLFVIIAFILISLSAEALEFFSSAWGVKKRGGSKGAGFGAMTGSMFGLIVGSAVIPIPLIGSLLGLFAGTFVGAFSVEYYRMKHTGKAAHIAWGALVARTCMILLKLVITLGMTAILLIGLILKT
ncbi:MAG: DUF456 domain-containing protein [Spartobacteria bacterium]|nr:DUF456 domain-containing protein [Spartobacteria bacterium]